MGEREEMVLRKFGPRGKNNPHPIEFAYNDFGSVKVGFTFSIKIKKPMKIRFCFLFRFLVFSATKQKMKQAVHERHWPKRRLLFLKRNLFFFCVLRETNTKL